MYDAHSASTHLRDLLRREHAALAEFLLALSEFDRGRGWEALGYTSCFYFLHRELGLSKSAAFYRSSAVELLQRFPEIVEPLQDGRLCLSSVAELAKVITPENRGEIVARFFHASKQEAKAVVAELRPAEAPPVRDVVRAVAARPVPVIQVKNPVLPDEPNAPARDDAGERDGVGGRDRAGRRDGPGGQDVAGGRRAGARPPPRSQAATAAPSPEPQRDQIEPLTADLRRFHVTVSQRVLDKLAAARDALSHSRPGATTEDVLEAALDLLLAKKAAPNGLVAKPRHAGPAPSSDPRHIPAAVKRAVWLRDGGRCQFRLASGEVCGATRRLQLDHVVPVARGGASTADNLRLTCQGHNLLAARRVLGDACVERHAPRAAAAGGGAHAARTSTAVS